MFSLLLSGRLGELLAPRPDFDDEVTSLLKAGLFDAALTLLREQNLETRDLNKLDKTGLAPIHVACASGAMEFLVELTSLGAEISLPASSGSTALHFAAINNRKGIIEVLLRSGADPSTPNSNGLLAGELTGDREIRMLLSQDTSHATLNTVSAINRAREDLRMHATSSTDEANLNSRFDSMTIQNGRDGGAHPSSGSHPSTGVVVSNISNLSYSNSEDETTHYNNSINDFYEDEDNDRRIETKLREAVLQAATDTAIATQNIEGWDNRKSVAHLCQDRKNPDRNETNLRRWLRFDPSLAGCRVDAIGALGQDGYTPLHVAAKSGNINAMEILLEFENASAWAVDLQGRTPLHIAAGNNHHEACLFLRNQMQLESADRRDPVGANAPMDLSGTTPVGWAAVCTKGKPSSMIKESLFQPGDKTVLPLTPIRLRAGTSPRRGRVRATDSTVAARNEVVYAYSVAQGWKAEMEDKVVVVPAVCGRPLWSFFAVCDGHGGDFVASYLSKNLPDIVTRVAREVGAKTGILENDGNTTARILGDVLTRTCADVDTEVSRESRMEIQRNENGDLICKDSSGSTGVLCIISNKHIAVANVGDSRALLAQWNPAPSPKGVYLESPPRNFSYDNIPKNVLIATALSVDHKFCIPEERERAEAAGAIVSLVADAGTDPDAPPEYEVSTKSFKNGSKRLRMSRSFGDFYLKQNEAFPHDRQAVTAVPDVVTCSRSPSDVFVLLACDGVYDVMDNQEIVDLLSYRLGYSGSGGPSEGSTMVRCAEACDFLLEQCVAKGAHDNLSALLVMCGVEAEKGSGESVRNVIPSTGEKGLKVDSYERYPERSTHSPGPSTFLGSPSSGAKDRAPLDSTIFAPNSPYDSDPNDTCGDSNTNVNRHLEFNKEFQ